MEPKKKLAVTIVEVASRCGLSISTVSRALHSPDLVREETRERIAEAIRETGYIYNANAAQFAKKKNNLIGVITPTATDSSFSTIVNELQMMALQKGYDVFIANSFYSRQAESRLLQRFLERRVSAVAMLGYCMGQEEKIAQLRENGVQALVLWSAVDNSQVSCITIDGQKAAWLAADYLLKLGHTRIGFILGKYQTFQPARDRLLGYAQAYAEAGLDYDKRWVAPIEAMDIECGRLAMEELMRLRPRPTAVITADDALALGALIAAGNLGLKVPGDISLLGMDDADFSSRIYPPLTTVHIPRKSIARNAAEYLIQVMEDREEVPALRECLPISLVERDSCGPNRA